MARLTRRGFLITSGAALPLRAGAAPPPSEPVVALHTDRVVIQYGSPPAWLLHRQDFGATASFEMPEQGRRVRIVNLLPDGEPCTLDLLFSELRNQWYITATITDWARDVLALTPVPLEPFLAGNVELRARLSDSQAVAVSARSVGAQVRPPPDMQVRLRRSRSAKADGRQDGLEILLDARRGAFQLPGVSCQLLRLAPRPARAEADWRAAVPNARLPTTLPLGRSRGGSVVLSIQPGATLSLYADARPARITGGLELQVLVGERREGPVRATAARLGGDGGALSVDLRIDPGHWALRTRHAVLGVSGPQPEGKDALLPWSGPIVSTAGRITRFPLGLRAYDCAVSVPDAELARLDFCGAECALDVPLATHSQADPAGTPAAVPLLGQLRLVMGSSEPSTLLSLDKAQLRLARSLDLLSLRYRFRGLHLELREKQPPRLVADLRTRPGTPAAEALDDPVLVVEFPPQHLTEQAYLRQDVALPDLDPPLTPQDRYVLLSNDASAAQQLRKSLFDAKRSSPRTDENADAYDEFCAFNVAWSDDTGLDRTQKAELARERPWLGPDGIRSSFARQRARMLAWNRRLDRLQGLKKALSAPAGAAAEQDAIRAALAQFGATDLALDPVLVDDTARGLPTPLAVASVLHQAALRSPNHQALLEAWAAKYPNTALLPADWMPSFARLQPPPAPTDPDMLGQFLADRLDLMRQKALQINVPDSDAEGFKRPAGLAMTEPSRLAFALPQTCSLGLTLSELTDWDRFDLRVVLRAQRLRRQPPPTRGNQVGEWRPVTDVESLLRAQFPGNVSPVIKERLALLTEPFRQAPADDVTALNLPARLTLSPAQDAKWWLSHRQRRMRNRPAALWEAVLREAEADAPSLRAIWSPDFQATAFSQTWTPQPSGEPVAFRTGLTAQDRHELVVLTAMHGLPARARRNQDGSLHSSQFKTPDFLRLDGLEPPMLLLAGAQAAAIQQVAMQETGPGIANDAIYLPQAMRTRRLALSALGATLDLEQNFLPPAGPRRVNKTNLFDALSLERWVAQYRLGRLELEETLRKGFLFPHGVRASLVRTTQREIITVDPGAGLLDVPIAAAVQRISVRTNAEPKLFPATGQPLAARGCPFRSLAMVTTRTPDLLDPTEEAKPVPVAGTALAPSLLGNLLGDVGGGRQPSGYVFWPRTEPGPAGNVHFRMLQDGQPNAISMPLLFVENRAANDPKTVGAVVTYWNAKSRVDSEQPVPDRFNVVQHHGTVRRYADERKPGDTSLITDWQEIDAEGQEDAEPYNFSPALQGADQPPFYPVLRQAGCRSQQLSQLTGAVAASFRVAYDPIYLKNGFTEDHKTGDFYGERYLLVVGTKPRLDMGANGDRAGGAGRPSAEITAFDRKLGPDGRVKLPEPALKTLPADMGSLAPPPAYAPPFDANAKLLGLISINTIFGLIGKAANPTIQEILTFDSTPLQQFGKALRNQIGELQSNLSSSGLARQAYPALTAALDTFHGALAPFDAVGGSVSADAAAELWTTGQTLLHEVKRVAEAPLAPLAQLFQHDILDAKIVGETLPWQTLADTLRRLAASALLDLLGTGPWAEALVSVARLPGLAAADLPPLDAALRQATDGTVWFSPDPLAALVRRVLGGLTDAALQQRFQHALARALAEAVLSAAFDAGLDDAAAGALAGAIDRVAASDAFWRAPDPVAAFGEAVLNDPEVKRLDDAVRAQVADALRQRASVLLGPLAAELDGWRSALLGLGLDAAITMHALIAKTAARLRSLQQNADARCRNGAAALAALVEAAVPTSLTVPPVQDAERALRAAAAAIPGPDIGPDAELRRRLGASADRLAAAGAGLSAAAQRLGSLRTSLLAQLSRPDFTCTNFPQSLAGELNQLPAAQADLVGAALETGRTLAGLPTTADQTVTLLARVASRALRLAMEASLLGAAAERQSAVRALRQQLAALPDLGQGPALDRLAAVATDASAFLEQIDALEQTAPTAASTAATQLVGMVRIAVLRAQAQVQDRLEQATLRAALAAAPALDRVTTALDAAQETMRTTMLTGYDALLTVRRAAYDRVQNQLGSGDSTEWSKLLGPVPAAFVCAPMGWGAVALLVVDPHSSDCPPGLNPDNDWLHDETELLRMHGQLDTLMQRWRDTGNGGTAAPQLLAKQLQRVVENGLRPALTRLLDLASWRTVLEDALRQFTPFQREFRFNYDLPLTKLPGSGPITLKTSAPNATLSLASATTVRLQLGSDPASTTSTFLGKLPAFDVDIAGFLTLSFSDLTYSGGTGRSGKLDVKLLKVELKSALKFLEPLQTLFGNPESGGPYTRLDALRPAIEAGYKLNIGNFLVGTIGFLNIKLSAACRLPFGPEDARLIISLGTLDDPFLITSAPYGGGGFMSLESGEDGLVAAASFEYGGVAAIRYGPLEGTGRITTGIYVRTGGGSTALTALFFAGFTGHVACFGIASSFTLRMAYGSGALSGTAELRFAFSLGLAKVEYSVKVEKNNGSTMHAADASFGPWQRYPGAVQFAGPGAGGSRPHVTSRIASAHEDWGRYQSYFDDSLLQERP